MIPHNRPTLGLEEQRAAQRVIESGWLAQGPEVEAFENEICGFLGLADGQAVALSSGTAALFVALCALAAGGKTVGCPVYACSALTNAIALAGASPLPVDTAPDSPNIDRDVLAASGASIAIVPHIFGFPVELVPTGVTHVIEDCAQALGASIGGVPVGLHGTIGIFSFSATKLITSGGQGGMLVSRERSIVEAARDYREFDGRTDRRPRFNLQMTDLQAAIGRAQLRRLPSFLARRAEIFEHYRAAGFQLLDPPTDGVPVRYRCVMRSTNPSHLIARLRDRGIAAIVPVDDWELLGPADQFPRAAGFARTTVSLPIYPSLATDDLTRITDCLHIMASEIPLSLH